ncbi:MAG TPA: ABC transporter permease, partial [Terracidiphilus sp.]
MTPTTTETRQASFQQTLLSARRTMLLSEILRLALDSFRASKLRFALTALGMVIGTASVILVVTIGLTGKQFILNEIQKIGTNEVEVEYAGGGSSASGRVLYNDPLTRDDEKAVLTQVPSVIASSPVLETHDRISFGGGVVKDTLVLGVSPQYKDVRNLIVLTGRFFDDEDEKGHIKCAVVTVPFAVQMFGSSDGAIGQSFQILGIPVA